jgi:hypothetical protein
MAAAAVMRFYPSLCTSRRFTLMSSTFLCLVCNLFPLAQHIYKIGRITAKSAGYRVIFDLFSLNCKKSRLTLCRKINLVRHGNLQRCYKLLIYEIRKSISNE